MSTPLRLLPDVPLPAYRFVPGQSPHPYADPHGHHYAPDLPAPQAPLPERWRDSPDYLLGLDLFNAGFFWEAHEMWERLWHLCGRRGETADFLKALIKLAAAGVKHGEGKPAGVLSHARRAAELWRRLAAKHDTFLGLPLAELIERAEQIERDGWPQTSVWLQPTG
jgi:hypothetical protein